MALPQLKEFGGRKNGKKKRKIMTMITRDNKNANKYSRDGFFGRKLNVKKMPQKCMHKVPSKNYIYIHTGEKTFLVYENNIAFFPSLMN